MFNLWDYYSATGLVLFWFCFWECIAFSWGYGVENIYDHIEDMIGYRINPWLKICWKYITPSVILALFSYSIIQYNFATLGDYKYPMWANLLGIAMGVCSTIFVPLYFLYSILIAPGNKVYEVKILSASSLAIASITWYFLFVCYHYTVLVFL